MRTPANIKKHPIHPMLITIPIGLWLFSLICDLVFVFGGGADEWRVVAFYTMVGGIVGALCAAVPGFIDMLSLPSGLKRIALVHMAINLSVVALYAINVWVRATSETATALPVWLSVIAVVMLSVSGWLGGKLVYVHGVAVESPPEPAPSPRTEHMRA